jgi:hypothetical protein
VDPFPDPLLLTKSGSAGNRTWAIRSVIILLMTKTEEIIKIRKRRTEKRSEGKEVKRK